jgi:YD repeat-containing protein
MKNILFSLLTISTIGLAGKISGQTTTSPLPSSFQNYVNVGVSPATGIPSVNIPIYNLESSDTSFPISISLSYHPYNALDGSPASEVGSGWTLFKGGSVSRVVIGDVDESKNISDITESEADVFYYTIPGYSGKFNIHKSTTGNDLVINNISGTKLKIEYTRDLTSTKLIINSFKITDDKGYQYYFNDYNVGTYSTNGGTKNHKTGFELNQVKDAGNHEIVSFTYDKKVKYIGASTTLKYQYCKVKEIITSKGKITFTFDYEPSEDTNSLEPKNDPYSVKNVVLTDKQGVVISKYELDYGRLETTMRSLISLKKINRNLALEEQTNFEYNDIYNTDYSTQVGGFCSKVGASYSYPKNILKKITFPTKGYIIYEFESNELYTDRSSSNYTGYNYIIDPTVQYYAQSTFPYNTSNSLTYTFQVQGSSGLQYPVYLTYESNHDGIITDLDNPPPVFTFNVKNAAGTIMTRTNTTDCNTPNYKLYPGTYTITTNNPPDDGVFWIYQLKSLPVPYNNRYVEPTGARIKTIRSYDSDGTLVKTKNYEYNSFANSLNGTGFMYYADLVEPNALSTSSFILYKNVKETEISGTQNNGSIRYSFKIPEDYKDTMGNYPFFNLTSQALMEKKEVLNSSGQLQEKTEYEYTISEIPGASGHALTSYYSYIPGFVQYTKETSTVKYGSSNQVTSNEVTISPSNFQQVSSKLTTHNGDIQETFTKYALDLADTRLINANMISVPLETVTKENGNILLASKTLFGDTSHFYPTSIVVTDLAQNPETQMTFDVYDDKGNLVQSTDKAGNSVTTIWGYYQTLPIAQITGAKYSDIASVSTIATAITASNADADNPANESSLLTALGNLRLDPALQQYPISVSSYDPLVGVTNTVSSNGIKQTYEYDALGRLFRVKNASGQIIKENQYNYKP